jgi:hypothetical protein
MVLQVCFGRPSAFRAASPVVPGCDFKYFTIRACQSGTLRDVGGRAHWSAGEPRPAW